MTFARRPLSVGLLAELFLSLYLSLCWTSASAQIQMPSEEAIRDFQASPKGQQATRLPADEVLRRQSSGFRAPQLQALPAAPASSSSSGLDIARLAERLEAQRLGQGEDQSTVMGSGLVVMVSLGMPEPSLQRLLDDAERVKATLVLRGLRNGSLKQTAERIKALMGERQVAWRIDPVMFRLLQVQQVPTYALFDPQHPLRRGCAYEAQPTGACSSLSDAVWAKVSGDVSITHALQRIAQDDERLRLAAEGLLHRAAMPEGRVR